MISRKVQLAGAIAIALLVLPACGKFNYLSSELLTETVEPTQGNAKLTWVAPTQNANATPLADLAGYKVLYGTSPGAYTQTIDVGNVTTHTVSNLPKGSTYYFTVRAYDLSGNESTVSNESSKTL
jgi:predicted phage tail protein